MGLDAERDGPTGLQPAVLHSAGLQSRGCSSVFLIWLNSDLGGKNSKERMSEGPGKMTQCEFRCRWFQLETRRCVTFFGT